MPTYDIRTHGSVVGDVFPLTGTLAGFLLTSPATSPTHILRRFHVVEEIRPSSGERTIFLTTLPTLTDLPEAGWQAVVTAGVYASMVFENDGSATLAYREQSGRPIRSTVFSATDRNLIGAKLSATQEFWFGLSEQDGTNVAGFYKIVSDGAGGGIQIGPYVIGDGGSGSGGGGGGSGIASGITIDGTAITNLSATNVRDALAEHQTDIDAINTAVTTLQGIQGQYAGSAATKAALDAITHQNGDWGILSADDGANQAGIYVGNGTTFSLAFNIPEMSALATDTAAGLIGPAVIHTASPAAALPATAARVGQMFVRTGATNPGLYVATDLVGGWAGPVGAAGAGATNLSVTASPTNIVVASDTGTDATIGLADGTNAGLVGPGFINAASPAATLPATADRVGQLFVRTGATNPGLYLATDLVGGWTGPLTSGAAGIQIGAAITGLTATDVRAAIAEHQADIDTLTTNVTALQGVQGQYVGAAATKAALDAITHQNGDWGILNTDDGANQAGIYVGNGTTFSLAFNIPEMAALATDTAAGLMPMATVHTASPAATLPATAARIGQLFVRTGATNPGLYVATDLVGGWAGPVGAAVAGTDLTVTPSPTAVAINSSTGTDTSLALSDDTNAGLMAPGLFHTASPAATLPATALRAGQLFVRTGATGPGLYSALDTVGNWRGPL